mmetsp:Transcript_118194/g.381483  ORF Transcript_118194/g.381483 Transcript_118194/m.381483 type:complete len:224 (+) Transcript_118194:828-1499(+)
MRVKAKMAMSASLLTRSPCTSEVLQIMRNMSPLFLFAAPWNSSTTPCTISAMRLTKVMTRPWSTSVAVLKSRIRTAPMMHSTGVPSTMALTLAVSTPCMFCAMMLAPASPKPSASRDPSLTMVFSRITVSMISVVDSLGLQVIRSYSHWDFFCSCLRTLALCISSALNSSSATFMAISGSLRNMSTFEIMFSTGLSTSLFASFEKNRDAEVSDRHTKTVMRRA